MWCGISSDTLGWYYQVTEMLKKCANAMVLSAAITAALMATTAQAVVMDGQPKYDAASDGGLYVWRNAYGNWQVRLAAGGSSQKFSGVFESNKPFKWIKKVEMESGDVAVQKQSGKLETKFSVWKAGEDGITFKATEGAGVCLRATGGVSTVYVGPKATPLSMPLDLTNSGACGQVVVQPAPVAVEEPAPVPAEEPVAIVSERKFNPGHYISVNRFDKQGDMINAIKPGITGIQKRYYWKSMEKSKGVYDFSEVRSDLELLAGQGMQLVVFVEDKTFNGEIPTPAYLHDLTPQNRNRGYTAIRWNPYVIERMKLLIQKLGQEFDDHPNFEGIAIQESSLSLNTLTLNKFGYTPEAYRDSIIEVLIASSKSMPKSQVLWYMNYLEGNQGYINDIIDAIIPHGVAMGGPDILPDSWPLQKHCYPFFDKYKGKLTLFNSMQYDSYHHTHKDTSYPTKYWTMGEMFRFARDRLHTEYIFWNRKTWTDDPAAYTWTDALPVIGNNPVFNQ